jgi:hypothetical protein
LFCLPVVMRETHCCSHTHTHTQSHTQDTENFPDLERIQEKLDGFQARACRVCRVVPRGAKEVELTRVSFSQRVRSRC